MTNRPHCSQRFTGKGTAPSIQVQASLELEIARATSRRAGDVIRRIEAQYEHERAMWEAHIEGLRKLVRSQRERIEELEGKRGQ